MRSTKYFFLLILMVASCSQAKKPPGPNPPPPADAKYVVSIRPIICENADGPVIGPNKLDEWSRWLNACWAPAHMQYVLLDPVYVKDSPFLTLDDQAEWWSLCDYSFKWYKEHNELCFWVVDKITWQEVGGLSAYPWNSFESLRFGVVVYRFGSSYILAHEFGHTFGLKHTSDWQTTDTAMCEQILCFGNTTCDCNVMSYCASAITSNQCNINNWFTPQQIELARSWLTQPCRKNATNKVGGTLIPTTKVEYKDVNEVAVDPDVWLLNEKNPQN